MIASFLAFAPRPNGGEGGGGMGIAAFLPWILIFVVFYLLILRPQSKRQKEMRKMLENLVPGDKIVTSGGIHGVITKVNDTEGTLVVKVGDDVKVTVDRGAVARKQDAEKTA